MLGLGAHNGCVGALPGHLEVFKNLQPSDIKGVTFIDSKMDGRYLISNGKDQWLKLWDIRSIQEVDSVRPRAEAMWHSRYSRMHTGYGL